MCVCMCMCVCMYVCMYVYVCVCVISVCNYYVYNTSGCILYCIPHTANLAHIIVQCTVMQDLKYCHCWSNNRMCSHLKLSFHIHARETQYRS